MRNRVIVTHLSPCQLLAEMTRQARAATLEIQRLASAPLAPGETCTDRALATSTHAIALADAFEVIDALTTGNFDLATALPHDDCQKPPTEESSGVMCPPEVDPRVN